MDNMDGEQLMTYLLDRESASTFVTIWCVPVVLLPWSAPTRFVCLYLIKQWFCESVDRFKGVYMVFATCIRHHWLADSSPLEESLVRVTQGCEECQQYFPVQLLCVPIRWNHLLPSCCSALGNC